MTEDQIIIEHTNRWLQETPWSIERFATELLVPQLEQLELSNQKDITTADELHRWKSAKGVQVGRIIRASMNFPMAWKWPWLNSLPEPYRSECRRDLLALAGVLDVPLPNSKQGKCGQATRANLADMMREFADVVASSAPAQDGVYDSKDDKQLTQRYIDEMVDVIEVLHRELFAVRQGTGCMSRRHRLVLSVQLTEETQ
ncbi:MAG: hypothetical protein SNF94_05515 [Rikenellaceae bacterium]